MYKEFLQLIKKKRKTTQKKDDNYSKHLCNIYYVPGT